ncbi:MAG TPA: DUF3800 domain-containing protein [Longimicrobium sp.]|nr:DUF3800 domain-containing protein [Longimicrobium sp.]
MDSLTNIYCDESCHLEHDHQPVMVLGSVICPGTKTREIAERVREIKARHGVGREFEVKWTKVSPGKVELFRDLVDYFFDDDDLQFRVLIAEKGGLRHGVFRQTHDQWYYKMYFTLLKALLVPGNRFHIYLDIKDTRGTEKVNRLHEILSNNIYDFDRKIIGRLQQVRSHEVEQIQLADLLIGAVSYTNRGLRGSPAKEALVARVRQRSRYNLRATTLLREQKFNIFRWTPQEPEP